MPAWFFFALCLVLGIAAQTSPLPYILRCRSTPQVSPRRRGAVSELLNGNGVVVLVPCPEAARLGGVLAAARFANAAIEESANANPEASPSRPGIAPPYNSDGSLQVAFAELMHVRRCCPPYGSLLRAVSLVPDAATTLSASTAALAAARLTGAGCVLMPEQIRSKSLEPGVDTHPAAGDATCGVAFVACGVAPVPAATPRTTRSAARGGGVAGALARLRRKADDPGAC